jgi:hypothetical protein
MTSAVPVLARFGWRYHPPSGVTGQGAGRTVILPGNDPHWGKLLDMNMLAGPGGRERTRSAFVDLFARAGLKLRRIIPTASPLSIVEGVPA